MLSHHSLPVGGDIGRSWNVPSFIVTMKYTQLVDFSWEKAFKGRQACLFMVHETAYTYLVMPQGCFLVPCKRLEYRQFMTVAIGPGQCLNFGRIQNDPKLACCNVNPSPFISPIGPLGNSWILSPLEHGKVAKLSALLSHMVLNFRKGLVMRCLTHL